MKDFKEYENKTLDDPEFLRIRELYTGKYIKRDHVYNFVHFIYYDDEKDFICFICDYFNRITIPYKSDTITFGKKYIEVFDKDYFIKKHKEIISIVTKEEYNSEVDKYIKNIIKLNKDKYYKRNKEKKHMTLKLHNKVTNNYFDIFYDKYINKFIRLWVTSTDGDKTLYGYFFIDSLYFDGDTVEMITDGFYQKFERDYGTSKFWMRNDRLCFDKNIMIGETNYNIEVISKKDYFSELYNVLEITKNNFIH